MIASHGAKRVWKSICEMGRKMKLSFDRDIKPLFRPFDIESMTPFGFDLSVYADVKAHAQSIYDRLADGSMPCDDSWSPDQVEKFKHWMDEGMEP
ncbi:hypothetical protein MYX78_07225 [Acidobacteria bacterium AH-259-G07]|nr:hypothetical protein [Acidobacteria bacterium AH-259-G07]